MSFVLSLSRLSQTRKLSISAKRSVFGFCSKVNSSGKRTTSNRSRHSSGVKGHRVEAQGKLAECRPVLCGLTRFLWELASPDWEPQQPESLDTACLQCAILDCVLALVCLANKEVALSWCGGPRGPEVFSWRLPFGDQGQAPRGLRGEQSASMKTLGKETLLFVLPCDFETH